MICGQSLELVQRDCLWVVQMRAVGLVRSLLCGEQAIVKPELERSARGRFHAPFLSVAFVVKGRCTGSCPLKWDGHMVVAEGMFIVVRLVVQPDHNAVRLSVGVVRRVWASREVDTLRVVIKVVVLESYRSMPNSVPPCLV